jgi:hypothetical protein
LKRDVLTGALPDGIYAGFEGHRLLSIGEMVSERSELLRVAERPKIKLADDTAARLNSYRTTTDPEDSVE